MCIRDRPRIAFSGVRSSWLMLARNALFARFAASAASLAACSSVVRSDTLVSSVRLSSVKLDTNCWSLSAMPLKVSASIWRSSIISSGSTRADQSPFVIRVAATTSLRLGKPITSQIAMPPPTEIRATIRPIWEAILTRYSLACLLYTSRCV